MAVLSAAPRPPGSSVHPDGSALVAAVVAVLVLSLLARWAFSPSRSRSPSRVARPRPGAPAPPAAADYGLLVPVAAVRTRADAEMLRDVLATHRIRCTVVPSAALPDGRPGRGRSTAGGPHQVLVFPDDERRARELVAIR